MTINAVIAWRLTLMTLLGRETPELPAAALFSAMEIAVLEDFAQDRKLAPPDTLGRAVLTAAFLGGYLDFKRKTSSAPGHQVLWKGYMRLTAGAQVFERAMRLNQASKVYRHMSDETTCR